MPAQSGEEDPMKVDATLPKSISETKDAAAGFERSGYDGLWVGESQHDPFLALLHAADVTTRMTIGTSVAIAFARTPMTVAYTAYDMALYAQGRFVLGLGSQVRPHVEHRFSMSWSHPAPRMREFVSALQAIWSAWQTGERLSFSGDFYTHTLMTPFFSPEAHDFGPPPVYLAGVGARMTEVAGEVCDGFFFHPFTTAQYLREVTIPALERGRAKAGLGGLDSFVVGGPAFTCVGRDDDEVARAIRGTKDQIAFYASTPAYRPVLELHGYGELQPELNALSKRGRWSEMGELIDDTVLHEFAVVGDPATVAKDLCDRWEGIADRISLYTPYPVDGAVTNEVAAAIGGDSPISGETPRPS
jgi:probable F420-dependent oxidoreductase